MKETDANVIAEYAYAVLLAGNIMQEGASFLSECEDIKDSDKTEAFMRSLMAHCHTAQESRYIVWLFHECMPRLRPFQMERVLIERIKMHARFADNQNLKVCYFQIPRRWEKRGWIRPRFDAVEAMRKEDGK